MKITVTGTYNTINDTVLTFESAIDRAEITLEFTGEDPDFGTETLVYGGDATATMIELCREQLEEITAFLDESCEGTYRPDSITEKYPALEDLNNSSLIAFERLLQEITGEGNRLFRNKKGCQAIIDTIDVVAELIRDKFISGDVRSVYIATECDANTGDKKDAEFWQDWYCIKSLDLPFDNWDTEIALLMGHCGGGDVRFAYADDDDRATNTFTDNIRQMIVSSTGCGAAHTVYVEFIGANETNPYEIGRE